MITNFGGPRDLLEIETFLSALFADKELIGRTLPIWFLRYLAKKRTKRVMSRYLSIGGSSPVYCNTEFLAEKLSSILNAKVLTFYRYLTDTHEVVLKRLEEACEREIRVLPLFPQFSYTTTGSAVHFFHNNLSKRTAEKLRWIRSYPDDEWYITLIRRQIEEFISEKNLKKDELFFLFSAHGLPKRFINNGDTYEHECELSYASVMKCFPEVEGILAYQSRFGFGRWLAPTVQDICNRIEKYSGCRKIVLFIPISFTCDNLETLFDIEQLYMPYIKCKGLQPYRLPCFNVRSDWVETMAKIFTYYDKESP